MTRFHLSALLVIAACGSAATTQQAAAPQAVYGPAAPAEVSTIAVPIRASLAPLLPQLETQVPKTFRDTVTQNGFTVSYAVIRDPIGVNMVGKGLHSSTTAHYSLKVCRGNLPCVSCGIDEPPRRADIALHTHLSWDAAWRIRSSTAVQPVNYPNRCRMSFLQYDVTNRFIAPVVAEQLRTAAVVIDRNTPSLTSIRASAQQIWLSLQVPQEIAPRTWLVFEPMDVGLAPLTGDRLTISTTLTIRARSRIVVGNRPAPPSIPLPALQTREASGGIRIPFDIQVPYDEATRLANERYGHRSYKVGGSPLTIGAIRINPAANGRIAVDADIDYRGGRMKRYAGPVHLEGTPQLDGASNSVVVPDLEYALDAPHRTLFARAAERFVHDDLRARLRQSAVYPIGKQLADAQGEINRSLTRQLAPGVTMHGRADGIEAQGVTAQADAIRVSMRMTGSAAVEVVSFR